MKKHQRLLALRLEGINNSSSSSSESSSSRSRYVVTGVAATVVVGVDDIVSKKSAGISKFRKKILSAFQLNYFHPHPFVSAPTHFSNDPILNQ